MGIVLANSFEDAFGRKSVRDWRKMRKEELIHEKTI